MSTQKTSTQRACVIMDISSLFFEISRISQKTGNNFTLDYEALKLDILDKIIPMEIEAEDIRLIGVTIYAHGNEKQNNFLGKLNAQGWMIQRFSNSQTWIARDESQEDAHRAMEALVNAEIAYQIGQNGRSQIILISNNPVLATILAQAGRQRESAEKKHNQEGGVPANNYMCWFGTWLEPSLRHSLALTPNLKFYNLEKGPAIKLDRPNPYSPLFWNYSLPSGEVDPDAIEEDDEDEDSKATTEPQAKPSED